MDKGTATPMLFPYDPEVFWQQIRKIVKEEVEQLGKLKKGGTGSFETPGLTYKPLYKMSELCEIFKVSKPTIYEWIKNGKLTSYKIQSRVYFLWDDIQKLITFTNTRRD